MFLATLFEHITYFRICLSSILIAAFSIVIFIPYLKPTKENLKPEKGAHAQTLFITNQHWTRTYCTVQRSMKLHTSALAILTAAHAVNAFQVSPVGNVRNTISNTLTASPTYTGTALYGKLWDKLQIEPDTMEDDPAWYVMNCVAGCEKDLLAQAKYVTRDISPELIEKIVAPTTRALRSHGKTQKVVEVRVMYPGYVFVKMRCCAETYEPLQDLILCRSWMAGTINKKGYLKLPPAPICLSDEEVTKFQGLEEESEKIYEKFGYDYTGKGDRGDDLIAQYEGFDVDNMVKILSGNFKGEDGVVKRLKDGQVQVRLFTYGNVNDFWFKPDEIRSMTDIEAMKGLGGPAAPVGQDDFDISIGKTPKPRENSRGDLKNSLGGPGERNRRQDQVSRGDRANKGSDQDRAEEEQNWRQFREEQRAEQQQKRGDAWGMKERKSWDAGDDAASFDSEGKWQSGREKRKEQSKNDAKTVSAALDGGGEWDLFSNDAQSGSNSGEEDDFFNSLMSELSDNLDSAAPEVSSKSNTKEEVAGNDDDFFTSLMSELSDSVEDESSDNKPQKTSSESFEEDDFFASLEADLSESLNSGKGSEKGVESNDDDDFFASLESDLSASLEKDDTSVDESFFGDLGSTNGSEKEDDFFASLESGLTNDLKSALTTSKSSAKPAKPSSGSQDLSALKVADLKDLLKARGLKVSGKKDELIDRLQQS